MDGRVGDTTPPTTGTLCSQASLTAKDAAFEKSGGELTDANDLVVTGLSSNWVRKAAWWVSISTRVISQATSEHVPVPQLQKEPRLMEKIAACGTRSPASGVWGALVPEGEVISEDSPLVRSK